MQLEHSSQSQYHSRSLSTTPVSNFINTPTKSNRHVRFSDSDSKSARTSATSIRRYLDNYSHKSSFPRSNGYSTPTKSYAVSVSQNSDKNLEIYNFEPAKNDDSISKRSDPSAIKSGSPLYKVHSSSFTHDSGVSMAKRSDPSVSKSEKTTPRYKFHSSSHTPDSAFLLGSSKEGSTPQTPKTRNANFSFAAKSNIVADEGGTLVNASKKSNAENGSLETLIKNTPPKAEVTYTQKETKETTHAQKETKEVISFQQGSPRTSPKSQSVVHQKREQPNKRIAEIATPETQKKSDPVKLPPTKQNGHLVHSDFPEQTRTKKTDDRDGRQLADPKKKKKTEEETNRQAKSAPPKRKDDVSDTPASPQVDNYTHRIETESPTNGKKKSTRDQSEKNKKIPAAEPKENKTKGGAAPNYAKGHENEKKEHKQDAESSNKGLKGQTEKPKETINKPHSNKTKPEDDRHKESPTSTSPVYNDKSRPVTKSNKYERNLLTALDDQFFSPVPTSDEVHMNEDQKEQQITRLRLPKKTRYGPVRAKGNQTPRTPRSRTPRARTPRNRYYRKTGYSQSDTGDYRSPGRKGILNNKEAVILESSRPKSYKWERDKSIYRATTKEWEDQRDELTWRPSVNSPTDWLRVYVGDIQIREKSARSRKNSPETTDRTVRPGAPQRNTNEYILTRRQVPVYKNMHSVYNNKLVRDKQSREKRFFQKLQECQALKAKMQISDVVDRQRKREITKQRQQGQLKELRQRFEDAAWVRFNTQYVTSRILEHEKMNRYAYGLPEEVDGDPEFESKLKRKPPKIKVDFGKLDKVNKKKYSSMFSIYTGPEWDPLAKTPPMEGIDTVDIDYGTDGEQEQTDGTENDTGDRKVKTRRVKDVIREAEKEMEDLKAKDTKTGVTPRASESGANKTAGDLDLDSDDDDDDMSDIFERARKKYNLEVDDETMSRSRR